tara:strand:- start:476 stop:820 length:345 start_codon:yes stop_codon:yes gene_type:complete
MYDSIRNNSFFLISLGAVPAAIFRWQSDDIFIANIIGCFVLGFVNALPISRNSKLVFGFGFCGSLTTFSGWTFHLFELISQGSYELFFFNSISILIIGLFAVGLGHCLAKKLHD